MHNIVNHGIFDVSSGGNLYCETKEAGLARAFWRAFKSREVKQMNKIFDALQHAIMCQKISEQKSNDR